MKHLLLTTIAAVVLVGCGESPHPHPTPEAKLVEPFAEAAQPGQFSKPLSEADSALLDAATEGKIEAVKQHLDAGADVNTKNEASFTPLHEGAYNGHKGIVELLITSGADVNAMKIDGMTPLDMAIISNHNEIAALLRKHGGKTGDELKAEGK